MKKQELDKMDVLPSLVISYVQDSRKLVHAVFTFLRLNWHSHKWSVFVELI